MLTLPLIQYENKKKSTEFLNETQALEGKILKPYKRQGNVADRNSIPPSA